MSDDKNCLNCVFVRKHRYTSWSAIYCGHGMHPNPKIGFESSLRRDGTDGKNCPVYEIEFVK